MTKPLPRRAALFVCLSLLAAGFLAPACRAEEKEIGIFFTGQSYAALYPCVCPGEREGGVARRAAALKEARAQHPGLLAVEAGALFGSGVLDTAAINFEVDRERTKIYLAALKAMGYDALLLSGQEFVFGASFVGELEDYPFVSSNVSAGRPYVLKEVNGVRVGVLGLTDETAAQRGAAGWKAPLLVLEDRVRDLRKRGAEVVVVLSSLSQEEDARLLKSVSGVDVMINGAPSYTTPAPRTVEGAHYLSVWWQARKAGLLRLRLGKDKKVELVSCDPVALGAQVRDDPEVAALLPVCIQDSDCVFREGLVARCERAEDLLASRCVYTQPSALDVTVIEPKECPSCQTQAVLRDLEAFFGKLRVRRLDAASAEARKIIDDAEAEALPLYVFEAKAEKHELFAMLSKMVEKKRAYYLLRPGMAGVSFFMKRPLIPGRLDVFFDLGYPHLAELAERLKALRARHSDLSLGLHFLAARNEEGAFLAQGGLPAIEEYKRLACLEAAQPELFFDYLICRAGEGGSGWWERCAEEAGVDTGRLRGCATGPEGDAALARKIALTRELEMAAGPALLVDNREIYGMINVPSLEELEEKLGLRSQESNKK